MRSQHRRYASLSALVIALLALAACGPTPPATAGGATPTTTAPVAPAAPSASGVLPVGPGPQAHYTVQTTPAPGSCHYRPEDAIQLPDPACTPGATSPAVTQASIAATICVSGYTAGIRPPTSVTGPEKAGLLLAYSFTGDVKTTELDHLVPLELGGDPNDVRNLWPEPNDRTGAKSVQNGKDVVENRARAAVCAGTMTLAHAQQGIASDWVSFGKALG